VRAFADLVGDPERLRTLLVLTVADIRAVGPGVWNEWKGQLMRALFKRAEAVFRGEDLSRVEPLDDHAELIARAGARGAAAEALMTAPAAETDRAATRVAIAATDRSGLFADLARALAEAGADVVGARVATAPDGTALDVFELQDGAGAPYGQAEPRRLTRLIAGLEAAALGKGGTAGLPTPAPNPRRAAFDVRPTVIIDLDETPGALADLARTLADHRLSIRSAHIAGFGERAVDAFYVTDGKGQTPKAGRGLERLRRDLEAVLDRRDAGSGRAATAVRASLRDVSDFGPRRRQRPVSSRPEAG